MFALAIIALLLAAVFGGVVLIVGCLLLISPKVRRLGIAVLFWGVLGAIAGFALFALLALWVEDGREPVISQVAGMISAAGFGVAGTLGGLYFLLVRGLRLPNRWADRRRAGPAS